MINQSQSNQHSIGITGSDLTGGFFIVILILLLIFGSTNIDKLSIAPGGA